MSDPTDFPFGANAPAAVGCYVEGTPSAHRLPVGAFDLFTAWHQCDVETDREAYLSVFVYPQAEFVPYFKNNAKSPKGYAGPAMCRWLPFDIDRPDLNAALADARKLVTHLQQRYPTFAETGIACYFSGSKGFHVTICCPPTHDPSAIVPGMAKRFAVSVADRADVRIDACIYDSQRLFRLPNSRHPKTGLRKRWIDTERELHLLNVDGIRQLAMEPIEMPVPSVDRLDPQFETDWQSATEGGTWSISAVRVPPSNCPVVPKFVRDLIGFGDVQEPGRAMTAFRAAAALAEAGTPYPVIAGLLEEPLSKCGLDAVEIRKQLTDGYNNGRKGVTT